MTRAALAKLSKAPSLETSGSTVLEDYRIIASIEDGALLILVVRIGNRKDVYLK